MNEAPVTHRSLLVRLRDHSDEQAWCEFTEIYGPLVYQLGKRRGLQEADAQDLVQEVFRAVARVIEHFDPDPARGSFRGWLSRIAGNLIINLFVAQKRHPRGTGETDVVRLMEEQPDARCEESALFEQEYRRSLLAWAAGRVRPAFSELAWQAFWQTGVEGKSPKVVAQDLGMSLGTVYRFMCAGHAPFRASSTPAVLRRVSDEQPRPIREINPDVPVWMAEIIERLHAKNPGDRFGSAGEVAGLLERALAAVHRGLPVEVAPRKPDATTRRPGSKAALVGVLSIAGCALALAAYERESGSFKSLFRMVPAGFENGQAAAKGDGPEEGTIVIVESSDFKLIVGSGKPVVKTWEFAGFTRMQIRSTFHAKISKGKTFKVTTTADDNVLPFVKREPRDSERAYRECKDRPGRVQSAQVAGAGD